MNGSLRKYNTASLICNAVVFLTTAVCVIILLVLPGVSKSGFDPFLMFTVESNIFAGTVSFVCLFFNFYNIGHLPGKTLFPKWLNVLKLVSTSCVELTFAVVVVYIMPGIGIRASFSGFNFFMHLTTPVVSILCFVLFENLEMKLPSCFFCLVPVCAYGAVYFYNVVILGERNGGWKDFYMFYRNGNWLLPVLLLLSATLVIGFLLTLPGFIRSRNRRNK